MAEATKRRLIIELHLQLYQFTLQSLTDFFREGLQEALKIGTENAVLQTGLMDGFFKNQAIKILMPGPLQNIEQPLRLVGYGSQIDEFVLSMNRAAEQAVPFAKEIFWDAIGE